MAAIPEIDVVAGCDIVPAARERFLERWGERWPGLKVYDDYREIGGVKIPSFRRPAIICLHAAWPSGVMPNAAVAVKPCGLSGGVTVVNGCVRDACSPGIVLAGTARSSIGKTGSPVSR